MSKPIRTISSRIFPDLYLIASKFVKKHTHIKTKNFNLHKEFRNAGYIRKVHSISKHNNTNNDSFYIAESDFFRGEHRTSINCKHNDLFIISDYYTSENMTFTNKLTLIRCDFNSPKTFLTICTKEAPFNETPLRNLETEIAEEISKLENIKIV